MTPSPDHPQSFLDDASSARPPDRLVVAQTSPERRVSTLAERRANTPFFDWRAFALKRPQDLFPFDQGRPLVSSSLPTSAEGMLIDLVIGRPGGVPAYLWRLDAFKSPRGFMYVAPVREFLAGLKDWGMPMATKPAVAARFAELFDGLFASMALGENPENLVNIRFLDFGAFEFPALSTDDLAKMKERHAVIIARALDKMQGNAAYAFAPVGSSSVDRHFEVVFRAVYDAIQLRTTGGAFSAGERTLAYLSPELVRRYVEPALVGLYHNPPLAEGPAAKELAPQFMQRLEDALWDVGTYLRTSPN